MHRCRLAIVSRFTIHVCAYFWEFAVSTPRGGRQVGAGQSFGLPLTAPRTERGWAETGPSGLKLVLPQCPPRNQQRPACFLRRFPAAKPLDDSKKETVHP